MRYRLIPIRHRRDIGVVHIESDSEIQAANIAEGTSERWAVPILLCRIAGNGLVTEVGIFGEEPEPEPKRKKR